MSEARRQRLSDLLLRERREKRRPQIVDQWAALGVSVSPVADDRNSSFARDLSSGRSWALDYVADYAATVSQFVEQYDLVAIAGWDVAEEPFCLVVASDLGRSASKLIEMYPEGFVISASAFTRILGVDWDADSASAFAGIFGIEN